MTDWPLDANLIRRGSLSNTFGMVRKRADGSPKPHQGFDLFAPIGTPVYAIGGGKVVAAINHGDYGLTVVHTFVHDGTKYYAAYCHLNDAKVAVGDTVEEGQLIGHTGDSGNAKGMKGADLHLHFEIRTVAMPGRGLDGRISPFKIYGVCPLNTPEPRKGLK